MLAVLAPVKSKFHLLRHVTTRTTCHAVLVPTWRKTKKHNIQVYKFSLSCSGFASISGTTPGNVRWTCPLSTPIHAVATPLNMCRASRACRDARRALLSDRRDFSRLPCAKMHGLDGVSCRDALSGIWGKRNKESKATRARHVHCTLHASRQLRYLAEYKRTSSGAPSILTLSPVADPEILKRERRKTIMHQPRCHISQMQTTNYMPFIREQATY